MSLAPYAKAATALVSTLATTVVAAMLVGSDGGSSITQTEWIGIACTTIIATVGVFIVPNKAPAEGQPPQG